MGRDDRARARAGPGSDKEAFKGAVDSATREAVERVLAETNGSVTEAAAVLGILRTSLYRIMKRHGIAPPRRVARRNPS